MSWAIVVPSNRPDRLATFRAAWDPIFHEHDAELLVVLDEPPWEGIPDFIPRRTDMVRSWAIYQAWREDVDYILSLDDDVLPGDSDPLAAYEQGFAQTYPLVPYLSVGALTTSPHEMRGFPYSNRACPVGIQYGGWDGVLDYDAVTQIAHRPEDEVFAPLVMPVPRGAALTTCAMNFAFRRDLAPLAWQLPLLDGRYNRMGDIWSGLFQKHALDMSGEVMLVNGNASIEHQRASDPWQNLRREAPGMSLNEGVWNAILSDADDPDARNPVDHWFEATQAAVRFFGRTDKEYADHFRHCRDEWLRLFE